MRRIAERLALFFIITQINRVANFIYKFQPAETTGYLLLSYGISIGLAYGVYISFYFIQKSSRERWILGLASLMGIVVFGSVDLFFNIFDVVVTVSQKALIPPTSSFAGVEANTLETAIQIAALVFGALPTVASATLGMLQGSVTMLKESEMGAPTTWSRLGKSFGKIFDTFAIRFAIGFEAVGEKISVTDKKSSQTVEVVDADSEDVVTPKRWPDLSQKDVDFILANGRKAIMRRFDTSNGTAGNWKADAKNGVMPWSDAKKLPQNV